MRPPVLLEVGALLRHVVPVAAVAAQLRRLIIFAPPPRRTAAAASDSVATASSSTFYRRLSQKRAPPASLGATASGRAPTAAAVAPSGRRRSFRLAQSIIKSRQGGLLRLRSLRFTRPGPPLAPRLLGAVGFAG